jgi:alpha-beta hydrolase superfamily lysophospholipase
MLSDNTSYTISASDGINLFIRNHSVKNSNKVILLIHGLGEHSGRYLNLIQDFNNKNISVFTIDIRGHGKSEGKRGHSPFYEQLMSDIRYFIEHVTNKTSNQKYFLYGHSFGGNLVINYSFQKNQKINGIIATSPCIKPAIEPSKIKLFMVKLFQKLIPSLRLGNGIKISGISRNSEVIKDYINDPLNHNQVSVQLGLDIISSGIYALENSQYITVPMLVFHGKNDELTSYSASKKLVENSGPNIKFIGFNDAYHEIHNEPEKEELLSNIFNWIDSI